MAYDDDYRELLVEARDAVERLLDESSHDSWLTLRVEYGRFGKALEDDDRERGRADRDATTRQEALQDHERFRAWLQLPVAEREHRILNALGDRRLSAGEIADRLTDEKRMVVHDTRLKPMLRKMLDRGELERVQQPRTTSGSQFRWLYKRRIAGAGELARLESALTEGEAS